MLFIITADHCASSAGKTDLPVKKYHIPLLIYAPKILKPLKINSLSSQIDVLPTVLGLLNFDYETKFWGQDVINYPADRAFISTYQMLGYLKDNKLAILAPKRLPTTYEIVEESQTMVNNAPKLINEAIAFYQSAYLLYKITR